MKRTNRRNFIKLSGAAGVTLAGGLAGCMGEGGDGGSDGGSGSGGQADTEGGGSSNAGASTGTELPEVEVGFSHYPVIPHGLPLTVGIENGFFEENGLKVKDIVSTGGGGAGARTITTGDIPMAMLPPTTTAKAFRQGAPLFIVGMATATPDIDYQTKADSDIETIQDVETIAVTSPASAGEANAVLSIQAADGISLDDIEFRYAGGLGEVISAITEGLADVGLNTNPISTDLRQSGDTRRVWHTRDYAPNYTEDILAMGPVVLESKPELARGFLKGWIQASEFIHENVEESGKMWAEVADFDESLAIAGLKDTRPEEFFQVKMTDEFVDDLETVLKFDGTLADDESLARKELVRDEFLPEEYQSETL